jgi:hypothetical protein
MARAEDRYISLETKTLPTGRTVYKPCIPISINPDPNTSLTIFASDQDRLDIIGKNVYGSAMDWWRIAAANKRVNGSVHIKPGTPLIIPQSNT